jgi:hypothetical protein
MLAASSVLKMCSIRGLPASVWSVFGLQEVILVPFPAASITDVQAIVGYFDEMAGYFK